MYSPLLLPTLKGLIPTINAFIAVGMSLFYVTPLTVDHEISQVTCMSDVTALIDRMESPGAIYRHLLPLANQGDTRVDVVLAKMDWYPYYPGSGNAFAFDEEEFLKHASRDPQLVDVVWRYRDWKWSADYPALHDDVTAEEVKDGTCLTRLFSACAGERPWSNRSLYIVCFYVPLTGHYELLEGHETEAEVIHSFDENIESLRAEIPYLRFDLETRKYVLDEEAMQSETPVDPRYQEWVGRPAGPAEGWVGENYVGEGSSTAE